MKYYKLPQGIPDILTDEYAKIENIREKLENSFIKNGCLRITMPGIDLFENYQTGELALPQKQMFKFTDLNGELLVVRPDITLAVARLAGSKIKKFPVKLCYFESVYKADSSSGREIYQSGVEFLGDVAAESLSGTEADTELIALAVNSVKNAGLDDFVIEIGHVCFKTEDKMLFGGREVLKKGEKPAKTAEMKNALKEIGLIYDNLCARGYEKYVSIDLSISKSLPYYSGIILTGISKKTGKAFLTGGRYDNLIKKFGNDVKATGFAVDIKCLNNILNLKNVKENNVVSIALPKGRLGEQAAEILEKCGVDVSVLKEDSRKLILNSKDNKYRFLLVKPTDVPIYIERGVADIGIAGKDTLLEEDKDIIEICDLKFGKCRLCLCGYEGTDLSKKTKLVIATKYVNAAKKIFEGRNVDYEIVKLSGSIELAPITDMSDIILDIVESGNTLKANGLCVLEEICECSARLAVNKVSLKTNKAVLELVKKIIPFVGRAPAGRGGL